MNVHTISRQLTDCSRQWRHPSESARFKFPSRLSHSSFAIRTSSFSLGFPLQTVSPFSRTSNHRSPSYPRDRPGSQAETNSHPSYLVPRTSYFSHVPTSTEFPPIRHSSFVLPPPGSHSPAVHSERVHSPIPPYRSPSYPQNRLCSEVETPPPPSYFVPRTSYLSNVPKSKPSRPIRHSSFVTRHSS